MKLYQSWLSPFAARCRIQIYAKDLSGVMFEAPDAGRSLNPIGKSPILADGDLVLSESAVICEYLEEWRPNPPMLPRDPAARAQNRLMGRVVDLYLYPSVRDLYRLANAEDRSSAQVSEVMAELAKWLEVLAATLRKGGHTQEGYAQGGRLSLADCAIVPMLFLTADLLPRFDAGERTQAPELLDRYWRDVQHVPACARVIGEMRQALDQRRSASERPSHGMGAVQS